MLNFDKPLEQKEQAMNLKQAKDIQVRPRSLNDLNIHSTEIWHAYEFSWLNNRGRPCIAYLQIGIPNEAQWCIWPLSLKEYLNSFSMVKFQDIDAVGAQLQKDIDLALGEVKTSINLLQGLELNKYRVSRPKGFNLDALELECSEYMPKKNLLVLKSKNFAEGLVYSQLLRFCDPQSGQPYWATIQLNYAGLELNQKSLLAYLVSFRKAQISPEACADKIFKDLLKRDGNMKLQLEMKVSRKGGLSVDVYRGNLDDTPDVTSRVVYQ